MLSLQTPIRAAVVSGTVASLATSAVLAVLARTEGRGALQTTNATSHWVHGPRAGRQRSADLSHTGVGFLTHHVSALFWALPFHLWLARRPDRTGGEIARDAALTAALAAVVDYGVVPRRVTPGWEHALSKSSIAIAYVALAAGLAAGALAVRGRDDRWSFAR